MVDREYFWIVTEFTDSNKNKRKSSYAIWNLTEAGRKGLFTCKNILQVYKITQEEKDRIVELSDLLIYNDNYELRYKYNCLIKEILKDKPNLRNNIKGKTYSLGLFG